MSHEDPPLSAAAREAQRTYLTLTLLTTLAASLIWGVNTLFLLQAGLTNTEAFLANAAFALGMAVFEIPTGVLADTRGRRVSFLLGTATLLAATLLYFALGQVRAPLGWWVVASILIGLGFTFFSGATEAWLVDALAAAGMTDGLDAVFGRAQAVSGGGMLVGSVLGGVLAEASDLGTPYLARAGLLAVTFGVAFVSMRDIGFTPDAAARPLAGVRTVLAGSVDGGLRNPPVRWLMVAALFTSGTGLYVFYALQPFLLELHGDPGAYRVAGLVAALVAGAQIVGGLLSKPVGRWFRRRTDALVLGAAVSVALLVGLGLVRSLGPALAVVAGWALVTAMTAPLRQSLMNGLIPSAQRATVLSFDSLMGSAGSAVAQPALGRVADLAGYPASYLASAAVAAGAIPFTLLARRRLSGRLDRGSRATSGS